MLEQDINTETHRAKMLLFASLTPGPTGKILAGHFTDLCFEAHDDFLKSLIPYVRWSEKVVAKSQEESRMEFIERYKDWVAKGCPVK